VGDGQLRKAVPALLCTDVPFVVLTPRALAALMEEAGSPERAARWTVRIVNRYGKPLAVHHDGQTRFFAPSHWSEDQLMTFIEDHREALEAEFGRAWFVQKSA
jgi:hypothetical protein